MTDTQKIMSGLTTCLQTLWNVTTEDLKQTLAPTNRLDSAALPCPPPPKHRKHPCLNAGVGPPAS